MDAFADAITVRAMLEVVLLGLAGALVGGWLLFGGLPYATESLAHGVLPGAVLASVAGVPLLLGAAAGLLAAALALVAAARVPGIDRPTATAVAVSTLFGTGVVLALGRDTPLALDALLFGDVLATGVPELLLAGGLVLALAVVLGIAHPRLAATAFDREAAARAGLRPGRFEALVVVALAATLLVALQGLGTLLVVAVLLAPAATAQRVARRLASQVAVAAAVATLGGVGGLLASFHLETAAGASVAALLVLAYLAARVADAIYPRRA